MKALGKIPFSQRFYWKGNKYRQLLRPKHPINKSFVIICCPDKGQGAWVDMPSGRRVKPVIRIAA